MRRKVVTDAEIAADHPCLPGHFPGRPIVPAVVLLDEVAMALRAAIGPVRITALGRAKFLLPVPPGRRFQISLDIDSTSQLARYQCRCDEALAVDGELSYTSSQ